MSWCGGPISRGLQGDPHLAGVGVATVFGMPVLATVFAGNELDGPFVTTMVVMQCLMVAVAAVIVVILGKSGSF